MLKVHVDNEHIEMTTVGDITHICADLSHILSSLNEELMKSDPAVAHHFRVMFTKGFMDGVCFNDDREHMEHYLAEGDERFKKGADKVKKEKELADAVNGVIEFLEEKRAELVRAKEELDKQLGKDSTDEAE